MTIDPNSGLPEGLKFHESTTADQSTKLSGQDKTEGVATGRLELISGDSSFNIAALKLEPGQSVPLSKKFTHVKITTGGQDYLVNVRSAAKRLHVDSDEVRRHAREDAGENFMRWMQDQAKETRAVLEQYTQILERGGYTSPPGRSSHRKDMREKDGRTIEGFSRETLLKTVKASFIELGGVEKMMKRQGELGELTAKSEAGRTLRDKWKGKRKSVADGDAIAYWSIGTGGQLKLSVLSTRAEDSGSGSFKEVDKVLKVSSGKRAAIARPAADKPRAIADMLNEGYVVRRLATEAAKRDTAPEGIPDDPWILYDKDSAEGIQVVGWYDYGDADSLFRMEALTGAEAKDAGSQLLSGLVFEEEVGLIHGDKKGRNTFFRRPKNAVGGRKVEAHCQDYGGATFRDHLDPRKLASFVKTSTHMPLAFRAAFRELQDQSELAQSAANLAKEGLLYDKHQALKEAEEDLKADPDNTELEAAFQNALKEYREAVNAEIKVTVGDREVGLIDRYMELRHRYDAFCTGVILATLLTGEPDPKRILQQVEKNGRNYCGVGENGVLRGSIRDHVFRLYGNTNGAKIVEFLNHLLNPDPVSESALSAKDARAAWAELPLERSDANREVLIQNDMLRLQMIMDQVL